MRFSESISNRVVSIQNRVDNRECTVHKFGIARAVGWVHFVAVKEIISYTPDSIQEFLGVRERTRWWSKLKGAVSSHEKVFGWLVEKYPGNTTRSDPFKEVRRQTLTKK